MADTIDLGRFTAEYVQARRQALVARVGQRNLEMERYEDIYHMDIWEDEPKPGQIRVTSAAGHQTVEDFTALLVTRKHAISVKPLSTKAQDQGAAQDVETWLYGFRYRTMFDRMLRFGVHDGICKGLGLLRAIYDPEHAADEFPIKVSAPNPQTVYFVENPEKTRFTELCQTWERTRREIEQEWGVTLKRPAASRKFKPEREQEWLDGLATYTEYFVEVIVKEKKEAEPEQEMKPKGVMELVAERMMGVGEGERGREGAEEQGSKGDATREKRTEGARMQRVRKVVHCVVVEDASVGHGEGTQLIKEPVVLVGYERIPFFPWSWILTRDDRLSALFAMTNGSGGSKSLGVLQAWNRFMSLFLTIAEKVANPPLLERSQNPGTIEIDATPGGVTGLGLDERLEYLSSPGVHPNVSMAIEELKQEMGAVSVPDVLRGFVVNMSGQAITASSSQFEMRIGFAQQDMEAMLQSFYGFALGLAKAYYHEDPDAWTVYGEGRAGKAIEAQFNPAWSPGHCWIKVRTSSSLPKDIIGMMGLTMQLGQAKLMSRRQAVDLMQKYMDLGEDTPDDVFAEILGDEMLTGGEISKVLAQQKAAEWVAYMTGKLGGVTEGEVAQSRLLSMGAGGAGAQGSGGDGFAPTNGMPPSVMAPTPDAVGAAGNLAGMGAMAGPRGPVQ